MLPSLESYFNDVLCTFSGRHLIACFKTTHIALRRNGAFVPVAIMLLYLTLTELPEESRGVSHPSIMVTVERDHQTGGCAQVSRDEILLSLYGELIRCDESANGK